MLIRESKIRCIHDYILLPHFNMFLKVTRWKNGVIKKLHSTANLKFILLSLFVYLLNNSSSTQFFNYWESAELVWGYQLSSLQKPEQKHDSQFLGGKIQIYCIVRFFIKPFFYRANFNCSYKMSIFLTYKLNC